MNKEIYEKPRFSFVDLRVDKNIANDEGNCMPQAAQDLHHEFYFDWPGDGWVYIVHSGSNCNGEVEFTFHDNLEIPGEADDETKAAAIKAAKDAFGHTGYEKQAFAGVSYSPEGWS